MIRFGFCDQKERGYVEFEGKYEEKYYKKYDMDSWNYNTACASSVCITKFRYINWLDKTGFVKSRRYELSSLNHKIRREYHVPRGFDHTSYWRKPGEKWPLFCLTEPYNKISHDEIENFEYLSKEYKLKYKIYEPSEKSLWYPSLTNMIFWWSPKYFDFEKNEQLLFCHENASEFEQRCKVIIRPKKDEKVC